MQEIELKFQIPAEALAALRSALRDMPGADRPPQRLQAAYFDTVDRKLARARAALRVRQEDDDWIQTVKAAGANAMTRLEDNRPVPPFAASDAIRPDLSRHVDEAVRQALRRDLGWEPDADPAGDRVGLLMLYRTDMQRTRVSMDIHADAYAGQVELALDEGEISAGTRRRPVCELEIELTGGDARVVLDVARALVRQHGLWLDTQTKAHRGDQLARESESGQASPMPPSRPRARVQPGMPPVQAWLAGVDAALQQIGDCLSEVALGIPTLSDGHASTANTDLRPWIRGWAVGLRRLRWLWRRAPQAIIQTDTNGRWPSMLETMTAQLIKLRPGPRQWLDNGPAANLARAHEPTLLALDVLAIIVAHGAAG